MTLKNCYAALPEEVSVVLFGAAGDNIADDTGAIQRALDSGFNVFIPAGALCKTTAPVISSIDRQVFRTEPGAALRPHFDGDVYRSTGSMSECHALIDGTDQPRLGAIGAAIVIGYGGAVAWKNSITGSKVDNFYGDGVRWDNGAGLDLTRSWMRNCTGDGYKCTATYDDNNHGLFADTEATNCGGDGYGILGVGGAYQNALDSRSHVFVGAKAYGCGRNFLIQTRSNVGSIFSEVGIAADKFDTWSNGNSILVIETQLAVANFVDLGLNNSRAGYTFYMQMAWQKAIFNLLQINNQFEGRQDFTQTADKAFLDTLEATAGNVVVTHDKGTAASRIDWFKDRLKLPAGNLNSPVLWNQSYYAGSVNIGGNGLADGGKLNFTLAAATYGIGVMDTVKLTPACAAVLNPVTGEGLIINQFIDGISGDYRCTLVNKTGGALGADVFISVEVFKHFPPA